MKNDRYCLPPSPCSSCFHGPSSLCKRSAGMERNSGGCRVWTEWFIEHWPKVCREVRRRIRPQ